MSFIITIPKLFVKKVVQYYLRLYYTKKKTVISPKSNFYNTVFEGYSKIYEDTELINCFVGLGTFISARCKLYNIKIGKFCSIAPDVVCVVGNHPTKDYVTTHPAFFSNRNQAGFSFSLTQKIEEISYINYPIICEIENDVWIGQNSLLLNGIKIGNGAIIAAGSVVIKDVPPYEIWGGVPAKKIRDRFTKEQIEFLQNFRWWDKSYSWLKNNVDLFENVDLLMDAVKNEKI